LLQRCITNWLERTVKGFRWNCKSYLQPLSQNVSTLSRSVGASTSVLPVEIGIPRGYWVSVLLWKMQKFQD